MKKIKTIFIEVEDHTTSELSSKYLYTLSGERYRCKYDDSPCSHLYNVEADMRINLTFGGLNSTHYCEWAIRSELKDPNAKSGYRSLKFKDIKLIDALMSIEGSPEQLYNVRKEIIGRKEYGDMVFRTLQKTFPAPAVGKIEKELDVCTIEYICILEKERGEVKRSIEEKLLYALKYHSWAHFKNVVGEEFPTMKNFDKMKQATELWLTL